jgi:hypothetical protein
MRMLNGTPAIELEQSSKLRVGASAATAARGPSPHKHDETYARANTPKMVAQLQLCHNTPQFIDAAVNFIYVKGRAHIPN